MRKLKEENVTLAKWIVKIISVNPTGIQIIFQFQKFAAPETVNYSAFLTQNIFSMRLMGNVHCL